MSVWILVQGGEHTYGQLCRIVGVYSANDVAEKVLALLPPNDGYWITEREVDEWTETTQPQP